MNRELLAVVLVAIATTGVARADRTNNLTPIIRFDKTVYDFGTTSLVESLTGTFTFYNAGTGELKIGKPLQKTSVKPDSLKSGEKGELVFTVSVSGQRGALEKHITVSSNDPQTPKVSLSVKVEMKQILDVSPRNIDLGNVRLGTITNVTVLVQRTDGKKLVITKAEPSNRLLHARIEPGTGTNDQSASVIVEVESKGTPRQFSENVKLSLEDVPKPVTVINVHGRLLGDVLVAPAMLYWPITDTSSANSEALPTREIKVSAVAPGQQLRIKNLTTDVKDLNLELVTRDAGKAYVVVARFTQMPKHSVLGTIEFETNTATQPKVAVPVTITVRK